MIKISILEGPSIILKPNQKVIVVDIEDNIEMIINENEQINTPSGKVSIIYNPVIPVTIEVKEVPATARKNS